MFSKKKLTLDLKRDGLDRWRDAVSGEAASGTIRKGAYELGPNQGGITLETLPVRAGRAYRVEFKAQALADPETGATDFRVGPVFLDATGKIVGWWQRQAPIAKKEKVRKGFVEQVAPDNAAAVCIGVFGSWAQNGKPANGVVVVSDLSLSER